MRRTVAIKVSPHDARTKVVADMMTVLLAVLALGAAPPSLAPSNDNPPADVEGLQQIYDQSCAAREYGAFDDVCDQLRTQLRQAEREAAREAKARPRSTPPAAAGSIDAKPSASPPTSAPPLQPPATRDPKTPS